MHESQFLSGFQAPGPLFVVGIWRSGTSLLYALLNQHPQIALMYEGELPLMRPLFPGGRPKSDWLQRWDFWNGAPRRHQIGGGSISAQSGGLAATTEYVCRQFAHRKRATIWGCKSPSYYDILPRLAQDFPQARFIIIWRDPAAICQSIMDASAQSHYFAKRGMLLRALLGYEELKRGCDHLLGSKTAVHQMHYEDLTRDPEAELKKICGFLRLPFVPRMLSLQDADRSAIYADEHHALVKGTAIVSSARRPAMLDRKYRNKIAGYVRLWKERYAHSWPAYHPPFPDNAAKVGLLSRTLDRALFRALRFYDNFVLLTYSYAPLAILRGYRERAHATRIKLARQEE